MLVPIAAELGAARETIVSQAERLEAQAETIGRQGAELEAERRARQQFLTERDAAEAERRRLERRLRVGLAVAGALVVAAGLAPGWVR